ncbi:MAG TPA: hypothetical protein DEP87_01755 [Candidatus Pacebacteria bacterium]|nr:hypothetical protein [Candidatus Paceibacterota bacterium]
MEVEKENPDMGIVKTLVNFLGLLLLVGAIGVLLTREAVLILGMNNLKSDFESLRQRVSEDEFAIKCLKLDGRSEGGLAQLRFINKTEYALEVICADLVSNPITVAVKSLPPLVKKRQGDSGLMALDNHTAEIELTALGRTGVVTQVEAGTVRWSHGQVAADHEVTGPLTTCEGYGLTCCSETEEAGSGTNLQGVVDCPKTCYSACSNRPVVLSFNTQPYYDPATRIVTVATDQEVEFSYILSDSQKDIFAETELQESKDWQATLLALTEQLLETKSSESQKTSFKVNLDFGDGQKTNFNLLEDRATHRYTCAGSVCTYVATLTAQNQAGAQNQLTALNKITIMVKP